MVNFIEAKPLVALDGLRLDDDEVTPTLTLSLSSVHPGLDGCVLDGVLTAKECAHVVATAERAGFSFWASDGPSEENRRMRNADTLEFVGTDLCAQLWERIAPFVTARSAISADQARSERDLEGEWAAAGLNEHLLVNRYGAGGSVKTNQKNVASQICPNANIPGGWCFQSYSSMICSFAATVRSYQLFSV